MKAVFNATCDSCGKFKPRCATVFVRAGKHMLAIGGPEKWCANCRKCRRGEFKVDKKHK